jgi:2-polyprenyl-3-methyl-5-hydroxy-6-metoxy-1,4-benzoquinol methylase
MTSAKHGFDKPKTHGEGDRNSAVNSSRQNIYDHPRFFEGYRALRQDDTGLNGALEVPALRALLPDLAGKNVLDLGCGFGDFARYAKDQGARSVTALDVSERMIAEAKRLTTDDAIVFVCGAIEDFATGSETFDLAVSSMALHYVKDFEAVARRVFDALKPGGCLILSVEHPICTANPAGWIRDQQGKALYWALDRYQEEGERKTSWFVDCVVKFHRTTEAYVNTLISSGFRLCHLGEPQPQPSFLYTRPWLAETLKRPPVLMLAASRP